MLQETKKKLCANKNINTSWKYNNYKHTHLTKKLSMDRIKGRNREFYNSTWKLQYPSLNNG